MYFFFSSAADRDISKHKVEGDAFIQGRASFRGQYGDGDRRLIRKEKLDGYVTRVTTTTFEKQQLEKLAPSMAAPTHMDGKVRFVKPARTSRQELGHSYTEWTEGKSDREESGGGSILIFIVFLIIVIIIVRKLT